MGKIEITNGKSKLLLRKSKQFAGLKTKEDVKTSEQPYVNKEVIPMLGGFDVVSLNTEYKDLDSALDHVRSQPEVEVGTHVYFAEGSKKPMVPTGEIFIEFAQGVGEDEQKIVLDEFALKLVERRSPESVIAEVTPHSPNPLKVAAALQKVSLVIVAEPDIDVPLDEYTPVSDTLFNHEWHIKNLGRLPDTTHPIKRGADAKIEDAWTRLGNKGKSSVVVAVIDNGFDLSHPDLKNKVYKPFDVWRKNANIPQGPEAKHTHGTPCASVAVASANGSGIVGVAPNSKFMPVNGTSFGDRETERMFDYCKDNGADVISCSWGTIDRNYTLSYRKEKAIQDAARKGRNGKGSVILFAVGNDQASYINHYAAHPDVIAVAASDSQDKHAYYSNKGVGISVSAPSNGDWPIIAARAWWDQGYADKQGEYKFWMDGKSRGSKYKHFGGTSSATPLVAGICALMLSANPDLTAKQVKSILEKTADKIGASWEYDGNGYSKKYGYGRVNADKAVAEAIRLYDQSNVAPTPEVEEPVSNGRGLFLFDVKKQAAKGYGVQIGAFYEYGNVLIQVEQLQKQFGEKVVVSINELNGKTVYKVVVGVFNTKAEASKLRTKIKNSGKDGFVRNLKDLT